MSVAASIAFIAPADSARAVTAVYTASLLATLPLVLAALGALGLRRASPEARVLVWRSTLVALIVAFIGRQLPLHWVAWVVPSTLATPLVALGRVQMAASSEGHAASGSVVNAILGAYLLGVALVAVPTALATWKMRRLVARARVIEEAQWVEALAAAKAAMHVRRPVLLVASDEIAVPMTWGWRRPVIAIPLRAMDWSRDHRAIVLRHELAHVRAGDWTFAMIGRLASALYWFHPAVWLVARGLRDECEHAADDRVLASGVRRTDYAELLIGAAERLLPLQPALALSTRRGLRARLASVLHAPHAATPLGRRWAVVAAACTVLVAAPMSAVQLAPTRDVLTTLMSDARWESRAYAVLGLARRADSIAVARAAAEADPNPRVRAWARYALRQGDAAQLRAVLHP